MTLVLLIIQIILALCLILVVLLQRNNSEGWSGLASSGSSGSGMGIVSKRSSANFLTRATAIIATLFMVNSLVLANLVTKKNKSESVIEKIHSDSKKNVGKTKHHSKENSSSVPLAE